MSARCGASDAKREAACPALSHRRRERRDETQSEQQDETLCEPDGEQRDRCLGRPGPPPRFDTMALTPQQGRELEDWPLWRTPGGSIEDAHDGYNRVRTRLYERPPLSLLSWQHFPQHLL
jgi:hypothetical protein